MYTYIYLLRDPKTSAPRYVGKSDNPEKRLKQHGSKFSGHSIEVLETVGQDNWREAERRWIKHFGDQLMNGSPGGDGVSGGAYHPLYGRPHTVESRLQTSESLVRHHGLVNQGGSHRKGGIKGLTRWGQRDDVEQRDKNSRGQRGKNKYPGVVEIKRSGRFQARACLNRKRHSLGHYDTPEEAYEVRTAFLKKHGLA